MANTKQLTSVAFFAALAFEFKKAWTITHTEALTFATDCMPAWFGAKGYDWSLDGAKHLVREYVETHGEAS